MSARLLSLNLQEQVEIGESEDPTEMESYVHHIQEWLQKQPHLTVVTDEQTITAYIRGCKFRLERAKEKFDAYYTMKTLLPEIFSNRDPYLPGCQSLLAAGYYTPLPELTPGGQRVILCRMANYDPNKIDLFTVYKTHLMCLNVFYREDHVSAVRGQNIIVDLADMHSGHFKQADPMLTVKISKVVEKAYPGRIKKVFIINAPSFAESLYKIVKPFLAEKLRQRIKLISPHGMEELYQFIPRHSLPVEYGGQAPAIDELANDWKKKVEGYKDWFLEDDKYRSNENKRIGKLTVFDEVFGTDGSFRQLNVD